jgi:hypothetical protein
MTLLHENGKIGFTSQRAARFQASYMPKPSIRQGGAEMVLFPVFLVAVGC